MIVLERADKGLKQRPSESKPKKNIQTVGSRLTPSAGGANLGRMDSGSAQWEKKACLCKRLSRVVQRWKVVEEMDLEMLSPWFKRCRPCFLLFLHSPSLPPTCPALWTDTFPSCCMEGLDRVSVTRSQSLANTRGLGRKKLIGTPATGKRGLRPHYCRD